MEHKSFGKIFNHLLWNRLIKNLQKIFKIKKEIIKIENKIEKILSITIKIKTQIIIKYILIFIINTKICSEIAS